MPAPDADIDVDTAGDEGAERAAGLTQELDDDDIEELEFLIDDIEDQIAPLAL